MLESKYEKIYLNALKCFSNSKLIDDKYKNESTLNAIVKILDNKFIDSKVKYICNVSKCSETVAILLLEQMSHILFYSDEEIKTHLSFVYNSDNLYASIFCNNNSYEWCSYDKKNEMFRQIKKNDYNPNVRDIKEDSVIRTLIDSTYREDIKRFARINDQDNLENRIVKLKKLKMNSSSYRIV